MTAIRAVPALRSLPGLAGLALKPVEGDEEEEGEGGGEGEGGSTLSPFGDWIAYTVSRVDETSELRVRRLDEDSTRVFAWGSGPRFSPDGRWLAWATGLSPEEEEALGERDETVRRQASVMDLRTGDIREFEAVAGYSFNASGRHVALRGYPPSEPRGKGADLRIVDLVTEEVTNLGNVGEMAWSPSGSLLALAIATGSDVGNGVQLYDAATSTLRSADASGSRYQSLRWRDDSADLAVLRSRDDASEDGAAYDVLAWRGLDRRIEVTVLGGEVAGLPDSLEVVRHRAPVWSDDGGMISVGVSFMGQIHWGGGAAELSHWETGQARMEVPFWEDPEAHRRNSPIHEVHNMETPLLMAFGDDDGVVDWDQGTEFYNFARRAGKQMVLLVYEGEDHGFREEANQKDYHRRILEWFGHYLKGEPAPSWITDGVPVEELEEEKKRVARGR